MLFNDDGQQESNSTPHGTSDINQMSDESLKMRIADSVKKNSEPLTWPRKSEIQPEAWCLVYTWNLVIMTLEE